MTDYLLDTNVVVWLLLGDRQAVPEIVVDEISNPQAQCHVSAASVWEIAIKRSLGKLKISDNWLPALLRLDFNQLPVTARHAAEVETLPWMHRDPFDRLLVAQAQVERCSLVSADPVMAKYDVPTLWS